MTMIMNVPEMNQNTQKLKEKHEKLSLPKEYQNTCILRKKNTILVIVHWKI